MNKLIYVLSAAALISSISVVAADDRSTAGSGKMKEGMPASGKAGAMGKSMDHPKRARNSVSEQDSETMKDGMPASGKAGAMGKSMDHPIR